MYCPKCGKALTSESIKFCSSCGLLIAGPKQIISEDEKLPEPNEAFKETDSSRLKGLRKGGKSLLLGIGIEIFGYLLGVAKLFVDGRTLPTDVVRDLVVPLGYSCRRFFISRPIFSPFWCR